MAHPWASMQNVQQDVKFKAFRLIKVELAAVICTIAVHWLAAGNSLLSSFAACSSIPPNSQFAGGNYNY